MTQTSQWTGLVLTDLCDEVLLVLEASTPEGREIMSHSPP